MRELAPYLRLITAYRGRLVLGAVLMFATAVSGIGLLALSGWFITATAVTGALMAAGIAASLEIYVPGGGIRAFAVTRTVARYFERIFNHDSVLRLLRDLRSQVFAGLAALPPAAMGRLRSGELLNRLTTDIDRLDGLYLRALAPPVVALLAVLLVMALLAIGSPLIALVAGAVLLVLGLVTLGLAWLAGEQLTQRLAEASAQLRASTVDHLNGMAELTAFASLGYHRDQVLDFDRQARDQDARLAKRLAAGEAIIHGGVQMTAVGVLLSALTLFQNGAIGGAVAVMMPLAVLALLEPLGVLPGAGLHLARARASARRLQNTAQPEAKPVPNAPAALTQAPQVTLSKVTIERGAGARVVSKLSLSIAAGECVGIIGPSGCGKSTLAGLIARQIDAKAGQVHLDEQVLSTIALDSLYASLGYLTQQTDLFSGTISANLRIAQPHADDTAAWQALRSVALDEFVAACPDGLDTWIGESGTALSSGQARRLALARIILRNPPLVILDEPLSGLDTDTAAVVRTHLITWLKGRTALVLGHDWASLPSVNRAFSLRAGVLQSV